MAARFGLSYLTAHMLGRPGRVGADHAAVLRDITAGGHEIGLHGYDHFWWAENIWRCGPDEIRKDMETGIEVFTSTIGSQPKTWAAPNWRSSSDSLRLMDGYGFSYASDCRGKGPFFPAEDGWRSGTLQLPVNLPCLHEIRRYLKTGRREAVIEEFLSRLESGFNVWCVHDYYEGILERGLFSALAERLIRDGFRFAALRDLAGAIDLKAVPSCGIAKKEIPGGRGMVSCQKI
jgi:peptidoglycan/xylan/chitin deacetylase (PgdA/CDA1 family)